MTRQHVECIAPGKIQVGGRSFEGHGSSRKQTIEE